MFDGLVMVNALLPDVGSFTTLIVTSSRAGLPNRSTERPVISFVPKIRATLVTVKLPPLSAVTGPKPAPVVVLVKVTLAPASVVPVTVIDSVAVTWLSGGLTIVSVLAFGVGSLRNSTVTSSVAGLPNRSIDRPVILLVPLMRTTFVTVKLPLLSAVTGPKLLPVVVLVKVTDDPASVRPVIVIIVVVVRWLSGGLTIVNVLVEVVGSLATLTVAKSNKKPVTFELVTVPRFAMVWPA